MGTGKLGPDSRLSWNHLVEHLCRHRTEKCFPSGSFFYEGVMIYALQKQFCSWWASAASKLTPARCGRREAMGAARGLWKLPAWANILSFQAPSVLLRSPPPLRARAYTHTRYSFEGLGF